MTKPWKPRASQIGAYLACPWRAATDRAIYEGRVQARDVGHDEQTGYGPHGTCIHWITQTGIGALFPQVANPSDDEVRVAAEHFGGSTAAARQAFAAGDARAWAPTQAEWALASTIFNGDAAQQRASAVRVSQVLASSIPKPLDGKLWLAESTWETDYCTGHIDLLSQDHEELEDIKTTSKPPNIAKVSCKPSYYAQMVIYSRFTGAKRGRIRYIDSRTGNWIYPVPIDFTTDANKFYSDQLEGFCRFLMSDLLWDVAWPNIGEHCEDLFCAYRVSCKHKIMPPPGDFHDIGRASRPSGIIRPGMPTARVA